MTKPDITLKDVAEHAYILGTVEEGEASTQRYWQARGLEPRVAFRTSSMESVRGLVAHGFGVTILSDMVFRTWSLEGKKIEVRPLNDAVPPMELGLIWKPDTELPTAAEAFRQFLIQACGM